LRNVEFAAGRVECAEFTDYIRQS